MRLLLLRKKPNKYLLIQYNIIFIPHPLYLSSVYPRRDFFYQNFFWGNKKNPEPLNWNPEI